MPDRPLPQADSADPVDDSLLMAMFDAASDDPIMQTASDILALAPHLTQAEVDARIKTFARIADAAGIQRADLALNQRLPAPNGGQWLRWNNAGNALENVAAPSGGGGGVSLSQVDGRINALIPAARRVPEFAIGDAGELVKVNATGTGLVIAPADSSDEAETLAVRTSQPSTAGFSVGDLVNVNGVLYELLASGAAPNVITGIADDFVGGAYRGTHAVQWRTAESGANPVIVRLPQAQLNAAPGGRPGYILVVMTTPDGFWGEDFLVYDHTRNTVAQGDIPATYGYDGGSVNFSQAPTGAHFTVTIYVSDAHGVKGAPLTVHPAQTRWEIDGRNHVIPTQQTIYPPVKDILQAGGNITISPNDANRTLLIAADVAGGMSGFVLGQSPGTTPIAEGIIDDDRLAPDTRQRMENGYRIAWTCPYGDVHMALAPRTTGYLLRSNRHPGDAEVEPIDGATVLPSIRQRDYSTTYTAIERTISFSQDADRGSGAKPLVQEGFKITDVTPLDVEGTKIIVVGWIKADSLDLRRPIATLDLSSGADLSLELDTDGKLKVSRNSSAETSNAVTVGTWHKFIWTIQRNEVSNVAQIQMTWQLDQGSLSNTGNVAMAQFPGIESVTEIAFGNYVVPVANRSWYGAMCDLYVITSVLADQALPSYNSLLTTDFQNRARPFGHLVVNAIEENGASVNLLAPGANLFRTEYMLQSHVNNPGRTFAFKERVDLDDIRGFEIEVRQDSPSMRCKLFADLSYFSRRDAGAFFTENAAGEALLSIVGSLGLAFVSLSNDADARQSFENAYQMSLYVKAGTTLAQALNIWPIACATLTLPFLVAFRPVYQ